MLQDTNGWTAFLWVAILAAALGALPQPAWAGENEMMDILIHKLVKKGVLTQEDAREIRKEVAEESARMAKSRAEETKDTAKGMKGGTWLDKVKWSGDLRLRHETQKREPAVDRNRQRFRLRFGFVTQPWDPLEIGVRLASGASGDPTSTNQSFTATFDKKAIFIDQAYGKYTPWKGGGGPLSGLSLIGGKMDNPLVTLPEPLVWDGDVTPEGVAMQWKNPSPIPGLDQILPVAPFINIGAFAISEISGDAGDPAVFAYQGGADIKLPFDWMFQPAATYHDFTGVERKPTSAITAAPGGNTTISASRFRYDYNLLGGQAKLSHKNILFGHPVSLFMDRVENIDNGVDDAGAYAAGISIGKVTEKFGSWNAFYVRKRVESDSVFGAITDSDFGTGGTNHKGHIFGASMGLNKWASIGLKYFRTDEIEGSQAHNDTLQADLQLKY